MTGNEIKHLRESYKLTVYDFAKIVGTSPSTVFRWEARKQGKVGLDGNSRRILQALGGCDATDKFVKRVHSALNDSTGLGALREVLNQYMPF